MTIQSGYVTMSAKMAEDFMREAEGTMPQSVRENITRFFEKAKARVAEKRSVEIEEVPEGTF